MTDSLIHLRVPAATKARWVRASRLAGMRLTDWISAAVEAQMQDTQMDNRPISLPIGLSDEKDWARVFWWDGSPETLRAGLAAIRADAQSAKAPWDSLAWILLTTQGCLSATNVLPAPRVGSVPIDDDAAITAFYRKASAVYAHELRIRGIIQNGVTEALGPSSDPLGSLLDRLKGSAGSDIAIVGLD